MAEVRVAMVGIRVGAAAERAVQFRPYDHLLADLTSDELVVVAEACRQVGAFAQGLAKAKRNAGE